MDLDAPELMTRQQSKNQLIASFFKAGRNGIEGDIIAFGGTIYEVGDMEYLPLVTRVAYNLFLVNERAVRTKGKKTNIIGQISALRIPHCDVHRIDMWNPTQILLPPVIHYSNLEKISAYLSADNDSYESDFMDSLNEGLLPELKEKLSPEVEMIARRTSQHTALEIYKTNYQAWEALCEVKEIVRPASHAKHQIEIGNRHYIKELIRHRETLLSALDKIDSTIQMCTLIPKQAGDV